MDDKSVDRIFTGSLVDIPPVSSKIVRIFTSSTFTDMSLERNHLMEDVYPRLKEYCREKHGLEFQVVDMRWGVRDEATDDHMTTDLCMREIHNCQKFSMGPNFVVFLGQKYGYRPIPTIIDGTEFRKLRQVLISMGNDVSLLNTWYQEDKNAVPSVFVLQPITSILTNFNNKRVPQLQAQDQAVWWETLENLQKLLRQAAQELYKLNKMDKDSTHNYMMSVTEREVINGILNVKNTKRHCLAYIRHINNINMVNLRAASKFIDTVGKNVDAEAQTLLSNLRDERLVQKMDDRNIMKYTVEWNGKDGLDDATHKEYLEHFKSHFYKYITKLVDRAMRKEDLSSQGQIVTEILQHLHTCKNSVEIFQGKEVELEAIKDYIKGKANRPLVLHGEGGCGKTSLLAKTASMVPQWCNDNRKPVLIIRFLGTTPDTSSVIPMLISICQQICYNFLIQWREIPDELIPLTVYLKYLLNQASKEQPIYIFLDSLDQLLCSYDTNKLIWLPTVLPPYVKIVVTVISQGECADFQLLQRMLGEEKYFILVKPVGKELGTHIIKTWLQRSGRDLTSYQWSKVDVALSRCTLPIFIKLIYAEVCRWRSYTRMSEMTLAYTVMDSIMKLFDRVETQHGKLLVSHALAYITASRSGLSETELEDLISLDDIVLDDVYQYHLPPVRRIPPLLWTRIRNDMPNYLTEREADGVSVMNWYHRQFRQAAMERYFKNTNTVNYFHSSIADYFLGIWGGGKPKPFNYTDIQRQRFNLTDKSGEADRKVPLQPLNYVSKDSKTVRYNLRKFGELPYHLVRSGRFGDLFDHVLFDLSWLHSKLCCCPLQSILADFEDAANNLADQAIREVTLVADALRLGGAILSQYPSMLANQLLARLLPLRHSYPHVRFLLEECDQLGPEYCALLPCYHHLHTPGGPLKYSLEGQHFAVFGFVLTSDKRYVLSVSNRFIMWDLSTGEITRDINPNVPGIMQTLVITKDNKFAASYTNYNHILILNLLSGEIMKEKIEDSKDGIIIGMDITESIVIAWSESYWLRYDLGTGTLAEKHVLEDLDYVLHCVFYHTRDDFHLVLGKKNLDIQYLRRYVNGKYLEDINICGGLVFKSDRSLMFLVQSNLEGYCIVPYDLNHGQGKMLFRTKSRLLQLDLVGEERFLVGITLNGFVLWELETKEEIRLYLPHNVRNIAIKPLKSQSSLVLTRNNKYALGGVRKVLYVWSVKSGDVIKTVDAHFGRILVLRPLVVDEFDGVISSSIDRTVKVWNIQNIFEQVYNIDRMDSEISSIALADKKNLAIAVTRNFVGIWTLNTGKLWAKLADNPVGAIVTHAVITSDGKFVASAESGSFVVWNIETGELVSRLPHKNICQMALLQGDDKILVVSEVEKKEAMCVLRSFPGGKQIYSLTYQFETFRNVVLTCGGEYLVFVSTEKEREYLYVCGAESGIEVHKMSLKLRCTKGFRELVPIPGCPDCIGLIGGSKSCIIDVKCKKLVKSYSRWSGSCTKNGRLGLYAPPKGGLELIELKKGKTVKTLLPSVSEGVFSVMATFTKSDLHIIYYHSGKRTIRLFRVSDGKMIANYRLSAEATSITSTHDGFSVVVGGIDGSFVVLTIVDPEIPESRSRLKTLPSRMEEDGKSTVRVTLRVENNRKITALGFA